MAADRSSGGLSLANGLDYPIYVNTLTANPFARDRDVMPVTSLVSLWHVTRMM
jgi:hypothetical protein